MLLTCKMLLLMSLLINYKSNGGRCRWFIQPRGFLASAEGTPTKLSIQVDKEKEATWGGSKVPGSTSSIPSMPPAL